MAKTKVGLAALVESVGHTEQLMDEVGLNTRFTHIYEQRGNTRRAGQCSKVFEGGFSMLFSDTPKELLPPVVALSSDQSNKERVYTTIHELAHINGGYDEAHDSDYCERFGDYLSVYLAQKDAPYKDDIKLNIMTDTYSPPIITAAAIAGERDRVRVLDVDNNRIVFLSPQQARPAALAMMNYRVVD